MRDIPAILWFSLFVLLVPAVSVASPRSDAVLDAMRIGELLEIMQVESERSGAEIDESLLGGTGGQNWSRTVSRINDAARLERELRGEFASIMPEDHTDAAVAFLTSEQGETFVGLELSARRVLLDPAIDEISREEARALRGAGSARIDLITRFVETNDLVDANVAGALTGNVAFLQGLRGGGLPPYERADDADLIAEVWQREPEFRADTEEWIFSYLLLAYQPLSDGDLEIYIAFSESEAGQALNSALFQAFDRVLSNASKALGEAVAQQLTAEEI